jgi:hypothetical protein
MYLDDVNGFDVEMLRPRSWADRLTGFAPSRSCRSSRRQAVEAGRADPR